MLAKVLGAFPVSLVGAGQLLFPPSEHVRSAFGGLWNVWEVTFCNLVIVTIGQRLSLLCELVLRGFWSQRSSVALCISHS